MSTAELLNNKKSLQSRTVDRAVSVIFPSHSFTYPDDSIGLVQSFIMLDKLAKRPGASTWCYKIMVWYEQADNLNVEINRTYRFTQCKLKLTMVKTSFVAQVEFDVHLSSF